MSENMKKFLNAVEGSKELQEKVNAAGDNVNAVIGVAKDAGFAISEEDIKSAKANVRKGALSDDDLEAVAGGQVIDKLVKDPNGNESVEIEWGKGDEVCQMWQTILPRYKNALERWGFTVDSVRWVIENQGQCTYYLFSGWFFQRAGKVRISKNGIQIL